MSTNGGINIQGCAYRITALNADGSITASNMTGMIQDDKPLCKLEAKPVFENGVEITPISACGIPIISYKDYDRYKRWEINLTLGDWDPEQMELLSSAQGALMTASGSAGRTFDDGALVENSNIITSASDASFLLSDVGRSVDDSASSDFIPADSYISEYISATEVRMNNISTGTVAGTDHITLGAQAVSTIGYNFPRLICPVNPNGVSIEIWSKLIVRCTGYQGTTPYPSAGTPTIPGSAYLRTGVFRAFLWQDAMTTENKEDQQMWRGWAIENPNFGTGPELDWTETAESGGIPVDTQTWAAQLCDIQLPTPLQPGYQETAA
jgi:hypothetical protein